MTDDTSATELIRDSAGQRSGEKDGACEGRGKGEREKSLHGRRDSATQTEADETAGARQGREREREELPLQADHCALTLYEGVHEEGETDATGNRCERATTFYHIDDSLYMCESRGYFNV